MKKKPNSIFSVCAILTTALSTAAMAVPIEPRSIDGSGNNIANPAMGQADTQLRRTASNTYADGISVPRGGDPSSLPSARALSNAVSAQAASVINNRRLSDWAWQWGQFVDHDIDLTGNNPVPQPFNIPVPAGDPFFDPFNTGTQVIGLNRSIYDPTTGTTDPRQQINQITAFIDASNVYGSDDTRAANLRSFVDGKLLTSANDLLPFNTVGEENAGGPSPMMFLAGDIRANEQVGLTSVHTLFMREHNRLADLLKAADPGLSDEEIYQKARKIVGAEMQIITYKEFLPALLGDAAASLNPANALYDANIDVRIANEFSTAGYRFGHTMLSSTMQLYDNDDNDVGDIELLGAFFNPNWLVSDPGNMDLLLKGLARQAAQEIDGLLVDDVRNFLFGPPGAGGFDLAALNIQRGRDHGLPTYNDYRTSLGLDAKLDFFDPGDGTGITTDAALAAAIESVYGAGNISGVDIWIGSLAEDHLANSSVGELIAASMVDQFTRLRDGDRFFYMFDDDLSHPIIEAVIDLNDLRLSDLIRNNTSITNIQDNVFFITVPEPSTAALGMISMALLASRRRRKENKT